MSDIRTVGDHGISETFQLDGAGLSLVGATAQAHIRRPDKTVLTRAAVIDGTRATFVWQDGDLSVSGDYEVEIEVAYSNGARQTFQVNNRGNGVRLTVRPQLG